MEEGISEHTAVKVSGEVEFNLAGDSNITWTKVGKGHPLILIRGIANPVCKFVNTGATRFEISGLFLFCCWWLSLTFSDVVVFLGTVDLTPETKFSGA